MRTRTPAAPAIRWFADAKAGLNHELERTLGSRPPQDWKGHAYEWIHLEGQDERTAFHAAAVDGQLHTVKLLAERGANVLDVDLANETALHAVACNGHIEHLLRYGASMRAADSTQETPLTYAQGSMRTLLWTTSATRGDVAGLRQLLAIRLASAESSMHRDKPKPRRAEDAADYLLK
eukprot:jgi/Chrpa1/14157/Chrysochromulina_OHIO_Genome00019024-RA